MFTDKNYRQSGIGAVAALAVLAILGIVGFTGWFVWHSNQTTNKINKQAVDASSPTSVPKITTFDDCAKHNGASLSADHTKVVCGSRDKQFSKPALAPVKLSSVSASAVHWSKLPASLQQFITDSWPKDCDPSETPPAVAYEQSATVQLASDNSSALAGIGCDGGSANILVYKSGAWKAVQHTQMAFGCQVLIDNNIPADLIATDGSGTCYDNSQIERAIIK